MGKRGPNATTWAPPDVKQKEGSGWKTFEFLMQCQCSAGELSGYYGVSESTIRRAVKKHYKKGFDELLEEKRKGGKASLRRISWQLALNGDKTMIIWLSKQHLNFRDRIETVGEKEDPAIKQRHIEAVNEFTAMLKELVKPKDEKKEKEMLSLAASLGLSD